MSFNYAVVWIDDCRAQVLHVDGDSDEIILIDSADAKEHPHLKANTAEHGNHLRHPDYFRDVIAAVGGSTEVLVVGPGSAKTDLIKFAGLHASDFVNRVDKFETMGRASRGELSHYARRFFGLIKPRLWPARLTA